MILGNRFVEAELVKQLSLILIAPPHHRPPPSSTAPGHGITVQQLTSTDFCNTICQKRPFSDAVPLARLQSMSRFRLTFRQAKWLGEFGELFRLGTGRKP